MIAYPWGALVTGIMLLLAGIFCIVRHFLLEPGTETFPKAPVFVRHGMFAFSLVLLFLGLQYTWVFLDGQGNTTPPQPSPNMQFLATALMFYKGLMLANIVRQHYPARTWMKLNRINEYLQCQSGSLRSKMLRVFMGS
jgi:hypothetical protein